MIHKILSIHASRLEEYLSTFHRCSEGLAAVGPIGNGANERPNKLMVCQLAYSGGYPFSPRRYPISPVKPIRISGR